VVSRYLKPRVSAKKHHTIRTADVNAFFVQLSTLVKSGTPLLESIYILSEQCESTKLAAIAFRIAKKVASGSTLYASLSEYPRVFKREWVDVIKSGEASGQLSKILENLVKQIEAATELKSKLVSAMMYPCIIMVVAVGAIVVMLVKVVPTFAQMFDTMDKELPGITQAVLAVSCFVQDYFLFIIGGAVGAFLVVRSILKTPAGRCAWHQVLVSLPFLGDLVVQSCMNKYASNLALLLRAGLPLHDAIDSLRGIFETNWVYRSAMIHVQRRVGAGGGMADALAETGAFTQFAFRMTRIGEDSGTLPEVLDQVETFYSRKVTAVIGRVTKLIETATILAMGITVAVILCSIYLPLFSMASGV